MDDRPDPSGLRRLTSKAEGPAISSLSRVKTLGAGLALQHRRHGRPSVSAGRKLDRYPGISHGSAKGEGMDDGRGSALVVGDRTLPRVGAKCWLARTKQTRELKQFQSVS